MDCGGAGHILLSKHVAEDLEDYARWRPYLHELGQCETKHGAVISVVNLYDDEVGNPQLPQKFKEAQQQRAAKALAKSIAVLPFENLSRDPDNAYFAQGIQQEILTRLTSIAGSKSHFTHFHAAVSKQNWQSLQDRETAWCSEHSGGKCAKSC
jgi:hypothetical protein